MSGKNKFIFRYNITSFELKLIAAVSMLIDHAGYILFYNDTGMRIIGRLAFPIFAFLLVEGFVRTQNIQKHMIKIFIFAIITEPIFDYALYGTFVYWGFQNVLFTFFLALLPMYIELKLRNKHSRKIGYVLFIVSIIAAEFINCDYGAFGIIIVMVFHYLYSNFKLKLAIAGAMLLLLSTGIQRMSVLAIPLLALYRGRQGVNNAITKNMFYWFYPAHLLILTVIAHL